MYQILWLRFSEIKKKRGKLRFPIYINEKIRTTELETLELSVRSSNCLHRAGYKTIGELVEAIESSDDLRKIRNCGARSIDEIMEKYNYNFIRVPVFESSELFHRGVGETTDIVTKETYDFTDRGGRNITLRPEGTAGVVRSYIENKV